MPSSMAYRTGRVIVAIFVVFHVTQVVLRVPESDWKAKIVVATDGVDQNNCGTSLNPKPCHTLDFALNQSALLGFNSTVIILKSGAFNYKSVFKITNADLFGIMSERGNSQDVEILCQGKGSLTFQFTTNVILLGIKLRSCGTMAPINNPREISLDITAALFFINCWNIRLLDVDISGSFGTGVYMYNVYGLVNISSVIFINNGYHMGFNASADENQSAEIKRNTSAGGMGIKLDDKTDYPLGDKEQERTPYAQSAVYLFHNCSFIGNSAPLDAGDGGGLKILIDGNGTSNSFNLVDCKFINNFAKTGGGLFVQMEQWAHNNTIILASAVFEGNYVSSSGGGVRFENSIKTKTSLPLNTLVAKNCSFLGNFASVGAGVSVYGANHPTHILSNLYLVVFKNCTWRGNAARSASAVDGFLVNSNEDGIGFSRPFYIVFDGCKILRNNIVILGKDALLGQGIVSSVQVPLVFQGNTTLTDNNGTALVLEAATLLVHDTVYFTGNLGYRGGAVALYSFSNIMLTKNSRLIFKENSCYVVGGAMYIYAPEAPVRGNNATGSDLQHCFFKYVEGGLDFDQWKTEIIFVNNNAPAVVQGNSVYATSLRDCRRKGETLEKNTVFSWKIVKFEGQSEVRKEVSTDAVEIQYNASDWDVSPGESFDATLRLIDEKNSLVIGIVIISVFEDKEEDHVRLATTSSLFLANNSVNSLKLHGRPNSKFSILFQTFGAQVAVRIIKNLTLRDCYPAFKFQDDLCVCDDHQYIGISGCSKNGRDIYLRDGFWAGLVGGQFVTYPCPAAYCTPCDVADSCLFSPNNICKEHREGVLCGSCQPGYSVLLGSEQCSTDCNNLNLLLVIPVGLLLFVVVMLLMLINVDVFTGYLNAWLYSYQVMALLTDDEAVFDPVIRFVIGLSNMQINLRGRGICIVQGLDDADKLALFYIFPYATMFSVFILGRIVRAYPTWCFSRRIKAPFRAICSIFVLCYTDITMISLKILSPAYLGKRTVLFRQGNVGFFEGKHIAYGILALLSLILVVIPFPLNLMFTPFFTKLYRPIFNLNNFKPYFDAFQGCFKDRYRWCSAFYFVARFCLLVITTYVPPEFTKQILIEAVCVGTLTLFIYLHPYKEEFDWINKLDGVLLTNLWLISLLSTGVGNQKSWANSDIHSEVLKVLVNILAYIPILYLIGMLGVAANKRYFAAKRSRDDIYPGLASISDAILSDNY